MKEEQWYLVNIFLSSGIVLKEVSMTKGELDYLKIVKNSSNGKSTIFETSHEMSDRILVDVEEISAIMETKQYGDN